MAEIVKSWKPRQKGQVLSFFFIKKDKFELQLSDLLPETLLEFCQRMILPPLPSS